MALDFQFRVLNLCNDNYRVSVSGDELKMTVECVNYIDTADDVKNQRVF